MPCRTILGVGEHHPNHQTNVGSHTMGQGHKAGGCHNSLWGGSGARTQTNGKRWETQEQQQEPTHPNSLNKVGAGQGVGWEGGKGQGWGHTHHLSLTWDKGVGVGAWAITEQCPWESGPWAIRFTWGETPCPPGTGEGGCNHHHHHHQTAPRPPSTNTGVWELTGRAGPGKGVGQVGVWARGREGQQQQCPTPPRQGRLGAAPPCLGGKKRSTRHKARVGMAGQGRGLKQGAGGGATGEVGFCKGTLAGKGEGGVAGSKGVCQTTTTTAQQLWSTTTAGRGRQGNLGGNTWVGTQPTTTRGQAWQGGVGEGWEMPGPTWAGCPGRQGQAGQGGQVWGGVGQVGCWQAGRQAPTTPSTLAHHNPGRWVAGTVTTTTTMAHQKSVTKFRHTQATHMQVQVRCRQAGIRLSHTQCQAMGWGLVWPTATLAGHCRWVGKNLDQS